MCNKIGRREKNNKKIILYMATNQTRQNILQVRGCLLKRYMYIFKITSIRSVTLFLYASQYMHCIYAQAQVHALQSQLFANSNAILLRIWLRQWDSDFDYSLNVQIITIRKCTHTNTTDKHTTCTHKCNIHR